ncbi:MAG: hypothetical protein EXX96DRAFT_520107 [Benjaminiella poitrasii]|nr:MAG: hypothetical protein EXX96DRAFT_533514 [Benjaminiella poitrasii]KAI9483635.1 MAG: hypothetical protein EXX96DRAFT_520107 [Benjaminiella poitrasii]
METIEASSSSSENGFIKQKTSFHNEWRAYIDRLTPYTTYRWAAFSVLICLFLLRIMLAQGWYIICYFLGIYLLNMFLAFLTPKFTPSVADEEEDNDDEGPLLPTANNDAEFKPFIRRLPEFKFWYSSTKATLIALICSFIPALDVPVFWPILLIYFCLLFAITMRRQIQHMIQYRYVPFDFGKRRYQKSSSSTAAANDTVPSTFSTNDKDNL